MRLLLFLQIIPSFASFLARSRSKIKEATIPKLCHNILGILPESRVKN